MNLQLYIRQQREDSSPQFAVLCYAQSCPTLSDPMDYSPPGCSVHGIFPGGILEQTAISLGGIFLTQGSNLHLEHLHKDLKEILDPGHATDLGSSQFMLQ